jgi:heptosyltransferase II
MSDRIFIRSTNWIGDAVMSVAALRELRRLHAHDHLTLGARGWVAGLFEDQGLVDEILTLESGPSGLKYQLKSVPLVRGFDRAVLFQNAFGAALTAFLARIPERVGYSTQGRRLLLTRSARPRIKRLGRHQIYYYLDLLYQTGLSSRDYLSDQSYVPDIRLKASERGSESALQLLHDHGVEGRGPLVGINPGAFFGSAKRWFIDRYAALADHLIEKQDARILIFGSAGEKDIGERISQLMRGRAVLLAGKTGLPSLMALISMCRLFITNDSGPMHLAAALDTPQIAIFGSTDEIATGPFSHKAHVIHKHVECSPCLLRECPLDLRCFNRIEVDEVYERASEILTNHG